MSAMKFFTGSYTANDVHFLLKPIVIEHTSIQTKEALIQSGQKHYSEVLTHESLPSDDYLELFYQAMNNNQDRMARHLILLAERILATRNQSITLVSLARAGTPIGVLLKHILARYYHVDVSHYSISILRDIGLDPNALRFILKSHSPESLVFVDGWTGKGVIARQLAASLAHFASTDGVTIPAELYVLADLCGLASVAASSEDYLIPSCILNATVSGLVSRSIYNQHILNSDDFHGCVYYRQFEQHDLSGYFIDTILARVESLWQTCHGQNNIETDRHQLQMVSRHLLAWITQQYNSTQHSYIKPGIGESTRVLLRREAKRLLLQDPESKETQHLRWLAESKSIPVSVFIDLPYKAVALIKEIQS
jgi:hypothetical protein